MDDPIFAPASPSGRAGVSVMRLSGKGADKIAQALVDGPPLPRAGRSLRAIRHNGKLIDHALILTFEKGASFTGETVVEFHTHGARAVIAALSAALSESARYAEPGEFTRRALHNERLDLAQVEGLADLINAETKAQLAQANKAFTGAMQQQLQHWRADLIRAASLIEATIDFADEQVPQDVEPEVSQFLARTIDALEQEIKGSFIAERLRDGFELAIVGPPNIGKSTLLNALAGRDAAITSQIAGTTRDVIEVKMDIYGLPVTLLDTAGLRDQAEEIEKIGIERTLARAQSADLRLFLTQDGQPEFSPSEGDIVALGKADINSADSGILAVSGKTGRGLDKLMQMVADVLGARVNMAGTASTERHRQAMRTALTALNAARDLIKSPDSVELAAAELRVAIQSLSALVGAVGVEDLLDEIFSSFCIGK